MWVTLVIFLIFSPFIAQAAPVETMYQERLTAGENAYYERVFEVLPSEVIEAYKADGGQVWVLDKLSYGDEFVGLYYRGNHRIELSSDLWHDDEAFRFTVHEFGHFVYEVNKDKWDTAHRNKLNEYVRYFENRGYLQRDHSNYKESETFALLYSRFYCGEFQDAELIRYGESFMCNHWHWMDRDDIEGLECYYINYDGSIYKNGITPDGYRVDSNGAWIENGKIQVQGG